MAAQNLQILLSMLAPFRVALTAPGFRNLIVLFAGWIRTPGTHAVTAALVATGIPGRRHHEAFHRFFSRGAWHPDELGRLLFAQIVSLVAPDSALRIAIDDTLAPKKGPKVYGIGTHIDAVRSTKRKKIFAFGHCWVTLAIVMPVPFSRRTWALPLLFRLYRNEKACLRAGQPHRKKTELARELLDVFGAWVGKRRVEASMDAAYCNDTVLRNLPPSFAVFGSMRPDAVLTALPVSKQPHANGRPRVRGDSLPKPEELAKSEEHPWLRTRARLYGSLQWIEYKVCEGQWYRATGARLLRIVIVRMTEGRIPIRVFFSTDTTLKPHQILEIYGQRWAIEVCFRNLKQLLGFADSSARKQAAVERTAPFVGIVYSVLVVWAIKHGRGIAEALVPLRPWYLHKQGLSFEDILRAAQTVLSDSRVFDLLNDYGNLQKPERFNAAASDPPLKRAA